MKCRAPHARAEPLSVKAPPARSHGELRGVVPFCQFCTRSELTVVFERSLDVSSLVRSLDDRANVDETATTSAIRHVCAHKSLKAAGVCECAHRPRGTAAAEQEQPAAHIAHWAIAPVSPSR